QATVPRCSAPAGGLRLVSRPAAAVAIPRRASGVPCARRRASHRERDTARSWHTPAPARGSGRAGGGRRGGPRGTAGRRRRGRRRWVASRRGGVPAGSGRRRGGGCSRASAFEPLFEQGQARLVAAVGGGQGTADEPGDLVERQPAPEPGDNHLAQFQRQFGEQTAGVTGIELIVHRGEPGLAAAGVLFATTTPGGATVGGKGFVADDTVEPGQHLFGEGGLPSEFEEGGVDDVLGAVTPLSRN